MSLIIFGIGIAILVAASRFAFMAVEVLAIAFSNVGVDDPVTAWVVMGGLLGTSLGFIVGLRKAGRKKQAPEWIGFGALVVILALVGADAASTYRPPPDQDPVSLEAGEWLVVLGSYQENDAVAARSRHEALQEMGIDASLVQSSAFPNLEGGLRVIVLGPYSRESAASELYRVRPLVSDAYIKRGWDVEDGSDPPPPHEEPISNPGRIITERIYFAHMATSATKSGSVQNPDIVRYLVDVRQGQSVRARILNRNGGDAYIEVYAPGRSLDSSNRAPSDDGRYAGVDWRGIVSRSGSYQFVVRGRTGQGRSSYAFTVIAEWLPEDQRSETPQEPDNLVYEVAEQMPVLQGGLEALQRSINYPEAARRSGIEGRVFIQFVVDEQGRPTDVRAVRGIGGGCDEAAVAAVRNARFTPGLEHGRPVKVQMSLPVTFRLPDPAQPPTDTTPDDTTPDDTTPACSSATIVQLFAELQAVDRRCRTISDPTAKSRCVAQHDAVNARILRCTQ